MSSCPTKDIHSIYLDNEMPEIYKAEYESHLKNCPKCQKDLADAKKLHEMFSADRESVKLDKVYLDQSYERLKIKLGYSKTSTLSANKKTVLYKYMLPSAAAAAIAVMALIIPIKTSAKNTKTAEAAPVATIVQPITTAGNVSFGAGSGKVISGNLRNSMIPNNPNGFYRRNQFDKNMFGNVDIFRPSFTDDGPNSIKITVPNMNSIPLKVEIEFPNSENVSVGQY